MDYYCVPGQEAMEKTKEALAINRLDLGRALAQKSGENLPLSEEEQKRADAALIQMIADKNWKEAHGGELRQKEGLEQLMKDIGI